MDHRETRAAGQGFGPAFRLGSRVHRSWKAPPRDRWHPTFAEHALFWLSLLESTKDAARERQTRRTTGRHRWLNVVAVRMHGWSDNGGGLGTGKRGRRERHRNHYSRNITVPNQINHLPHLKLYNLAPSSITVVVGKRKKRHNNMVPCRAANVTYKQC